MTSQPSSQNLASIRVAIDIVIFTIENDQLKVLLVNRQHEPFKDQPALPGGFVWEHETSHKSVGRILASKAGVKDVFVEQLYTFDAPNRDPRGRVISVAHYALVPPNQLGIDTETAGEAPSLVPISEASPLAFDHKDILDYAVTRLRAKLSYSNAAYSLLPESFTLSQLQSVYEIILGRDLDKRNFRKKYLSLGLIEPTSEYVTGARFRPAQLYRFIHQEPTELDSPAFGMGV